MSFIHKLGLHKALGALSPAVRPLLNAASERRLANAVNIADLRTCAKARMHPMCFGYLDSGSDDEVTLRRNHDAYAEFELHYHVLSGLSPETLDLRSRVFGRDVALPFFACPTAGNRMFHDEGEAAAAAAAAHHGTLYGLSSLATTSIGGIAEQLPAGHPKVFQCYAHVAATTDLGNARLSSLLCLLLCTAIFFYPSLRLAQCQQSSPDASSPWHTV